MDNFSDTDHEYALLMYLRDVAEFVRDHGLPESQDLEQLLTTGKHKIGGVIENGATTKENRERMMRWAEVLFAVRAQSDREALAAALRNLTSLGVPEAHSRLAINHVSPFFIASDLLESDAAEKVTPMRTSIDTLGFGILKTGTGAARTLTVSGGPGYASTVSDMVSVYPDAFGPEDTVLTITLKKGIAGQALHSELNLKSSSETKTIDIIGMWSDPKQNNKTSGYSAVANAAVAKVKGFQNRRYSPISRGHYRVLVALILIGVILFSAWHLLGLQYTAKSSAPIEVQAQAIPLPESVQPTQDALQAKDLINKAVTKIIRLTDQEREGALTRPEFTAQLASLRSTCQSALSLSERAITLDSANSDAWQQKTRALYYLGHYKEASDCLAEAMRRFPRNSDLLPLQALIRSKGQKSRKPAEGMVQ